ncbi:MAG: topoisomerase DNA-binding C4 zinc finger domain-containing protein [Syntrophaceae bacterium]|nr:topoisomerase DNA-binding C4 zinc finger domain-containing protein [Syntrophaceae bacterium]
MSSTTKEKTENKNSLVFIKEVAKYFMDFLETDFHKRRNPKRSVSFRNNNNLLVGLNLNKYPSFNNLVWKAINHAFDKNVLNTIQKSVYRTNIPKNLLDLVKLQSEKINNKQIARILEQIAEEIEKSAASYKKEYDQALSVSLEAVAKIIKADIVLPFISNLEKPLENLNLGDENNIYLMEEELTSVLSLLLENKISEILKFLLSKEKVDISKQLKDVFEIQDIKSNISSFFESFQVGDLFAEIYEMERNRTILDKQEFYLYFCDITFNKAKYPIFYIPFSVEKQNDKLTIKFDSQVYINKKALEYITQEYNQEKDKKGNLKTITERIIYLAQHQNDFQKLVNEILSEITNFFELDKSIDINKSEPQTAKSFLVRASNTCYVALFDKSDEALVNDYEEILKLLASENNVLADAFNKLIDDFIHKDPIPFNPTIEEEWDNTKTSDRLVFRSPIPLNSEQLQILSAIRSDGCKYIIVEGPPGTGKSHTITAIAFDSILKNQSVLVLSDKKEALDVVEDKITETMNKVRYDKKFQNPILRLGKTGSTYSQILASSAIENIKTHFRAIKKDYDTLESNIGKLENTLKEDLEAEILAYEEIDLKEIHELFDLESYYQNKGFPVDIDEVLDQPESAIELEEFRKIFLSLKDKLVVNLSQKENESRFFELLNFRLDEFKNISNFQKYLWLLNFLSASVSKLKEVYSTGLFSILKFENFGDNDLEILKKFIDSYEKERNWLFGYRFKREKIKELDREFKKHFNLSSSLEPHKNLVELKNTFNIFSFSNEIKNKLDEKYKINFDYLNFVHEAIKDEKILTSLNDLQKLGDDLKFLNTNLGKYSKTNKKLKIDLSSFKTLCENELIKISNLDFDRLIRYINLKQKIEKDFKNIPALNYADQKKNIEDLVTAQMTFLLDGRLIDFYENNKATARVLRDIIRAKQRFPKDEFLKLKEAFPCILAGIRDYAEYIPLEPEIFDLVIIDEASQVSIAQAFPALLRAKKVLILGDKKQFSNVKSAQARTDTNREYLNNLRDCFIKNISKEPTKLVKLNKFNIKTSILEFFEFISNYNTQLLKYFRGYKEIISYSNKYFYQDSLQVMKIRGKAIDEVLKFSFIKHDGKKELLQNTNTLEAEFIISELKKLKNIDSNQSVGIITPHTNQQKILVEKINKLPEKDYFYDKLKLKIMTFDTCQGEERDIIFYSMVATEEDDHLWGVFIKNLNDVDIEEDGKIKVQRLNVGLSRAKECMHFVLSKPIEKYSGSIGEALRHYFFILNEAKKERSVSEVDERSKMEPEVMNWFYQTEFWKKNKDNIEFIPQFELGKYLKQLYKTYNHPNYKVDFLLVYKDETHREHKIIIEYDGFREHFQEIDEINEFNYQDYYTGEDIYREKVLEGYGYRFLRINKFNIGNDPIKTLNERIENLIKGGVSRNNLISHIHQTIEGLQNGEMKECPKCKEIRDANDFRDTSLITGYGRFCKFCKGHVSTRKIERKTETATIIAGDKICPRCSSKMILRKGRYGKFYGCSRFPYCRGTRPY